MTDYCEACGRVLPSKTKAVGGVARWANSTPAERSEHARKMVAAREARKAPAPAPEGKEGS